MIFSIVGKGIKFFIIKLFNLNSQKIDNKKASIKLSEISKINNIYKLIAFVLWYRLKEILFLMIIMFLLIKYFNIIKLMEWFIK